MKTDVFEALKDSVLVKRILLILIAGLILIICDYVAGTDNNDIVYRDREGNILLVRPDEGKSAGHVYLKADVNDGKTKYEKNYEITVDPYSEETAEPSGEKDDENREEDLSSEEVIAYELRSAVSGVNDDISARKVLLPSSLSSGEKIYWSTETKTNTIPILFITITACILIYRNSQTLNKKIQKTRADSITRELPEFVNKLVLLLNAGLVLSAAFEKSVEESLDSQEGKQNYFYEKMQSIYMNIKETNSPLNTEFKAFARESGHNGLMRISNILSDNISKGVELTEKLQIEGEVLWLNRKRDCEERGRISETRLTIPLTLFLLVLIAITVSPALLEL